MGIVQAGDCIVKAMVLAAGLGKRMHPLTLTTPKPLIRIGDTTLIDHALQQIKCAGIVDVMINVHYLREKMIAHCGDGGAYGLRIHYSIEENLLETGGGILQALPFFEDKPFLLVSADVWTDYPLRTLVMQKPVGAHLVFVDNPPYHPEGDYGLDTQGLVHLSAEKKFTYSNIAVINPRLFAHEKPGIFKLSSVFNKGIEKRQLTGEHYKGTWFNVGTPADCQQVMKKLAS